jgi:predicted nucleic acid-binding protein
VRTLLESRAFLATTEPIVMEVLSGARDDSHLRMLRRLVLGCQMIPLRGLSDYEEAAAVYRSCRRAGLTVRRLVDCLIAIVAINTNALLLHDDSDFDLIAPTRSSRRLIAVAPRVRKGIHDRARRGLVRRPSWSSSHLPVVPRRAVILPST